MIQKQDFQTTPRNAARTGRAEQAATQGTPGLEDATLYTRHIKDGVPIRALARELGCHASTVLRRIRRFEERRDDPLVDSALAADPGTHPDERKLRQVLRRLVEPGAVLATTEGIETAIVTRDDIRTAVLDRGMAEAMALRGWVAQTRSVGRIQRYVPTPAGRAALRQMLKGETADGGELGDHADQHRLWADRVVDDPEDGRRRRMRVNLAESPLQVLARRSGANGQPFLSPGMVAAGERLREDFELAQMGPRVTQNWEGFLTAGIDTGTHGFSGGSGSARERVAAALRELGPELGDVAMRVCCFLEGFEMTERRLGWPARSGKLGLRLALIRLERHYQEHYGHRPAPIG